MKQFILLSIFFTTSLRSLSQDFLSLQDLGITIIYGDTKFNNAYSTELRTSQINDYTPKTIWMADVLPTASFFLNKRTNLLVLAGVEAHKIRNDFKKDLYYLNSTAQYKPFATNLLYKAGIGTELFIFGKRNGLLNFRLQNIITYENLIRRNTGNYFALGPFGRRYKVYDYATNKGRWGIDILPSLNINLTQSYSFKIASGYSFGLNKSNTRIATLIGSPSNTLEIFNRRESTFIFSIGLFYHMQQGTKRASLKSFNIQNFLNKIIYNE